MVEIQQTRVKVQSCCLQQLEVLMSTGGAGARGGLLQFLETAAAPSWLFGLITVAASGLDFQSLGCTK